MRLATIMLVAMMALNGTPISPFGFVKRLTPGKTAPASQPVNLFTADTDGGATYGDGRWNIPAGITSTIGQAGPTAAPNAWKIVNTAGSQFLQSSNLDDMTLYSDGYLGGSICFSIYMMNVNTPSGTSIRFYTPTGGAGDYLFEVNVTFASATSKTISSVTAGSDIVSIGGDVGYESAGGDWYRVWGHVPLLTETYDDWEIRLMHFKTTADPTAEMWYAGPQVNPGTAPDVFVPVEA